MAKAERKADALATMVDMSKRPEVVRKAKKIEPTPERLAKGDFPSMGMAVRLQPVIETLALRWVREEKQNIPKADRTGISPDEFAALDHYREQAHKAMDDDAQQSVLSPERIMGGGGMTLISGPLPSSMVATPAIIETARLERQLGSLLDIAHAIAVEDKSLTEWCIERHGGREKTITGNVTVMVPRGKNHGSNRIKMAAMELRIAAHRIVR